MGEERRTTDVANEINKGEAVSRLPKSVAVLASPIPPSPQTPPIPSPEPSMVPTPLIPVSPPVLRCLFDESTSAVETVAEQRANDVVSKDKTNVSKHSPEDSMPVPLSAHQVQTTPPCQIDELESPVDNAPSQRAYDVPNHSAPHGTCIVSPKHPSRDMRLPMLETSGKHLERAVAFIRERMHRRSSACDAFVPRARKDPPDKPAELDARQNGQETVSVNTTSVALHSPDNLATFMLLVPKSDLSLPSASVSPASPDNDLTSKEDQLTMTQTTSDSKTYQVEEEAYEHCQRLDFVNKGSEASVMRSHEVGNKDFKSPYLCTGPVNCPPASEDTSLPVVKTRGGEGRLLIKAVESRFPNEMELTHRVPEDSELHDAANNLRQWTGQEAISEEDTRELLCLPVSTAALAPHMSVLVYPLPAYTLLCPSMELEFRRQKPPDRGGGATWLVCYAVNEKVQTSIVKNLPLRWIVHTPYNVPPAYQYRAETHHLSNTELDWLARCKPPNTLDTFELPNQEGISESQPSVLICLQEPAVALRPPMPTPADPPPVYYALHLGPEDMSQIPPKPPDSTRQRPLQDAVSRDERGRRMRGLPALWASFPIHRRFPFERVRLSSTSLSMSVRLPCLSLLLYGILHRFRQLEGP